MLTQIAETEIDGLYQRVCSAMPDKPWLAVVQNREQDRTLIGLRRDQIRRQYAVAFGLATLERGGIHAIQDVQEYHEVLSSASIVAQLLLLTDAGSQRSLFARFRGALREWREMSALQFELHMAVSLHRKGCTIEWTDESAGPETFDMLVTPPSGVTFELECKTFSVDKGSQLPVLQAASLLELVHTQLRRALVPESHDLFLIDLQLHQDLPNSVQELEELSLRAVTDALAGATSEERGFCALLHRQILPPLDGGKKWDCRSVSAALEDTVLHFATRIVVGGTEQGGFIVAMLSTTLPGKGLKRVTDDIKKAVGKQLTGKRPGCVVARLEGIDTQRLVAMAALPGSDLVKMAKQILARQASSHLACIAFVGAPELTQGSSAAVSTIWALDNQGGEYPAAGIAALLAAKSPS